MERIEPGKPGERTKVTNLVLGERVLAMLDELCAEDEVNRSQMVRSLIAWVHGQRKKKPASAGTRAKGGGPSNHKSK